jgi:CelD/BcsL family acetyltransferase involved in cellulose biosynthesis
MSDRAGGPDLRAVFATSPAWFRRVRAEAVEPLRLLGFSKRSAMGYCAHEVALSAPFEDWRARTLDPSFLRFLDRKRKRLERRFGLELREMREPAGIDMAFTLMRGFRESRMRDDLLRQERYFNFYRDAAFRGLPSGLTRTFVLYVGGVPRAGLFGVFHKGRFAFLLLGFDFAGMRNASLGVVLIDKVIEDCIARGDAVFDLTIGDQPYKQNFCPTSQPMYGMWGGPRLLTGLAHAAYAQVNRLRYGRGGRRLLLPALGRSARGVAAVQASRD